MNEMRILACEEEKNTAWYVPQVVLLTHRNQGRKFIHLAFHEVFCGFFVFGKGITTEESGARFLLSKFHRKERKNSLCKFTLMEVLSGEYHTHRLFKF